MTYQKDWDFDETVDVIKPLYNDAFKRYDLSMQDVIAGINNSKYPINGSNVMVPDGAGGMKPLPDALEGGLLNPAIAYRLEMLSTNGNIIKDKTFATTLYPILYKDNKDITASTDEKYFKWTRISGPTDEDKAKDAEWNLRWATGSKLVPITHEDVNRRAMFQVQFVTEVNEVMWVVDAYNTYIQFNK